MRNDGTYERINQGRGRAGIVGGVVVQDYVGGKITLLTAKGDVVYHTSKIDCAGTPVEGCVAYLNSVSRRPSLVCAN